MSKNKGSSNNNQSNTQNANKGTSGTNRQYDQNQGNRGKQLDPTPNNANTDNNGGKKSN